MAGASVTLDLTDGAASNGKNAYLRLTGTLSGDRTLTMPSGSGVTRVWIIKDDTVRGTSNRTLSVLTASGTAQPIPPGSTILCKSNGTETVTSNELAVSLSNCRISAASKTTLLPAITSTAEPTGTGFFKTRLEH